MATATALQFGMPFAADVEYLTQKWSSDVCKLAQIVNQLLSKLTANKTGFRPPIQSHFLPNDLEKYTVKTDAWGLISLALVLVTLSAYASQTSASFKRAAVLVTVFHHVTTGLGAWEHYKMDSHFNTSMGIGVWANVWLTLVGLAAVAVMPGSPEGAKLDRKMK